MPITLYHCGPSAPCRAVLMVARELELDVEIKMVDLFKGEHMSEEYLAINPFHKVPTLDDDGFILWESRAIMLYLVNKYADPDSTLYPTEPVLRAQVDKMIFYDVTTFYKPWAEFTYPQVLKGEEPNPEKLEALQSCLSDLDKILAHTRYVASDELTLADFGLYSQITFTEVKCPIVTEDYPSLEAWMERMKELPYNQEVNEDPLNEFKQFLEENPSPMG